MLNLLYNTPSEDLPLSRSFYSKIITFDYWVHYDELQLSTPIHLLSVYHLPIILKKIIDDKIKYDYIHTLEYISPIINFPIKTTKIIKKRVRVQYKKFNFALDLISADNFINLTCLIICKTNFIFEDINSLPQTILNLC